MTVEDFNQQWAAKGYKLLFRVGNLRRNDYPGRRRYLFLVDNRQDRGMKKFPFPEHLVDVPQEVFDYLDYLCNQ